MFLNTEILQKLSGSVSQLSRESSCLIIPAGLAGFLEEVERRFSTLDYKRRLDATSWSNKFRLSYDRNELAKVRWIKDKTRLMQIIRFREQIQQSHKYYFWYIEFKEIIVLLNKLVEPKKEVFLNSVGLITLVSL